MKKSHWRKTRHRRNVPLYSTPCLECEGDSERQGADRGSDGHLRTGARGRDSCVTEDAVAAKASSGLDGAVHEASGAFVLHGAVESRLAAQNLAVGETRAIGDVGLKVDVCREDLAGTGGAQGRSVEGGLEENEGEVRVAVCRRVGHNCGVHGAAFEG